LQQSLLLVGVEVAEVQALMAQLVVQVVVVVITAAVELELLIKVLLVQLVSISDILRVVLEVEPVQLLRLFLGVAVFPLQLQGRQ
jgi:hypothetical protein